MINEIKWLKAAFAKKFNESGWTQRQFGEMAGISQAHVNRLLNSSKDAGPVEVWSRVAVILGYDLAGFLAYGRSLCEPCPDPPPSPETAAYLKMVRSVLEADGEKAEALKKVINIIKE